MTKRDLRDNQDLIDEAASFLSTRPVRKLSFDAPVDANGACAMTVHNQNIHRLDIQVEEEHRNLLALDRTEGRGSGNTRWKFRESGKSNVSYGALIDGIDLWQFIDKKSEILRAYRGL